MLGRPKTRRPGNTLVEVLVGLGILGIGFTSVITLFPFSALQMGQALKDDRTTTCATMGDGQARDFHQRYVVDAEANGGISPEPYHRAMDNLQPNQPLPLNSALPVLTAAEGGPSYPVFLDPMGVVAARGNVGHNGQSGDVLTNIPRVNLSFLGTNSQLALRYCSLLDSMTFDEGGGVQPGADMREILYTYAWMLQRPVNRDRHTVRMQVVVFHRRAHLYIPSSPELVYGARFTPGETFITGVPLTAEIRKGSWILDATVNPTHVDADNAPRPLRHAEFYRVVSITEDTATGTYALEVHKRVNRPDGVGLPYNGTLVVMPAVADVFERPVLTGSTAP